MLLKLIIENSNGIKTPTRILQSRVVREGGRTVDSASITVGGGTDVEQGDLVHYIQDLADLEFLTAIYNFQGAVKDESGNFLDPATQTNAYNAVIFPHSTVTVSGKTYDNQNAALRTKHNYCVVYHDKYTVINDNALFDFTQQFDIIFTATMQVLTGATTGDKRIFFSKLSHSGNGIEMGCYYNGTDWVGYARIRYAGIERQFISDQIISSANRSFTIRLFRNDLNEVIFSFDDSYGGSWYNGLTSLNVLFLNTTATGLTTPFSLDTSEPIWIGAGRGVSGSATNNWKGTAYQLRIYTGSFLIDSDVERLFLSPPTPVTMRFSGFVSNIQDSTEKKTLTCIGNSGRIITSIVDPSLFSTSSPNDASFPFASRVVIDNANTKANIYQEGSRVTDVLQSLLSVTAPEFIIVPKVVLASGQGYQLSGKFVAEGSLLTILKSILGLLDYSVFWSNGRKVLFIEDIDGVPTNMIFSSNQDSNSGIRSKILEQGKSDEYIINKVELIGRVLQKHAHIGLGSVSANTTTILTNYPLNILIYSRQSGLGQKVLNLNTDFTLDFDSRKITWLGNFTNVDVQFDYEDFGNLSNNFLTDVYCLKSNAASISKYGIKAKRFFVPNLTHSNDLNVLSQRLFTFFAESTERYQVVVPYLDCVFRENHEVTIKNIKSILKHGNNGIDLKIKQIEYLYPEAITKFQVGENYIDSFDYESVTSNSINSVLSAMQRTKN